MPQKTAQFRFYAELNDFLPADKCQQSFDYLFWGTPSVKDAIESIGVPHTEVDLILVNGVPVGFDSLIGNEDHISVYPVFGSMNVGSVSHLRENPLLQAKFILDVHLGKLARLLRMTGFDVLYQNDFQDAEIAKLAEEEQRIILTRDVGLLQKSVVSYGYFVRATYPWDQLKEVIIRFDLKERIEAFKRCLPCNGLLDKVSKEDVKDQLKAQTMRYYQEFFRCPDCGKIYWRGSHFVRMNRLLWDLFKDAVPQE